MLKKSLAVLLLSALITACTFGAAGCSVKDTEDETFEPHITYEEFGAVGDGKTDDFAAIKKAHEYANENNLAVKADEGKKYYIGAVEDSVTVKTSVDWSGAEFIVDDKSAATGSKVWWYPLFKVVSYSAPEKVTLPDGYSLKAGQEKLGLEFDGDVMLALFNDEKRDFIRYGFNGDKGWARQEIILADKNGKVDPSTPLQWDYEKVTRMTAYKADDSPIMLRGGKFVTIANDDPKIMNYFERGIMVERANVTVKNVSHYVVDEGATGSPYNGFFRTKYANNVAFENCVMTGHKLYKNESGNDQGTYDIRPFGSNNIRYLNCTQSNDHTDAAFWGVMCSDFCKNLYMDGCKLSRFDAHMGVYNAAITNSDIGQNISVTGGGTLRIENVIRRCGRTAKYLNRFVTLRGDYGSFFYGDVIIKDSTLITTRGINYVFEANWYDWDFGYECRFPETVTLDNVRLEYEEGINEYIHPHLYIFSHVAKNAEYTPEYMKASKNPVTLTKKVIIKNNVTNFKLTANEFGWFSETQLEYE